MRYVGIQEFTCFTLSALSPGNHHSRSLEGKYTFLGGSASIRSSESESVIFRNLGDSR